MPQQFSQTVRNTFNKGLLTEFSELNFPNEASVDELNCTLFKAGNRSRRLGLTYEDNNSLSSTAYVNKGKLYGTHKWTNVGEDPDVEFLVVQAGAKLFFYQRNSGALSGARVKESFVSAVDYEIDMRDYERANGLGPAQSHVEVASIRGRLVVVSPQIEPFYVKRDKSTGEFTVTLIEFKVRDFNYMTVNKRSLLEDQVTADVNVKREYDTKNCGWAEGPTGHSGEEALIAYEAANGAYPALNAPWYVGKDSGVFNQDVWKRTYGGTSLIVNGHYILDLFDQDRDTASGLTGVPSTVIEERFSCVAAFAGRVFYSGVDSKVYFSKILEEIYDIGNCYQVNDPTSEDFSDLLDTDGGFIDIPDASGIKKLHVFGSSLLVFANNGVWRISGVDGVFRATEFSVYKVTDEGLAVRRSFVAGQNAVPFWWSYTGIHSVEVTDQGGMVERNLSRDTIQSFWNNISGAAKGFCTGIYEGSEDRVIWLYPNNDEIYDYKLNRLLFLDVPLGAFYPWKVEDSANAAGPHLLGASFFNNSGSEDVDYTVVDESGSTVITTGGDEVILTLNSGVIGSSEVKFLVRDENGYLTFAEFIGKDFLDWGESNYSSYAESAYNFIGDLGRRKNSPYITVFCRVTEEGWESLGGGVYTQIRPSSILVSAYWDFRVTSSSAAQQGYRYKQPLVVDTGDLSGFDYPTSVIVTRLKTRGRGRVMKVRFESEEGKDFNLLGWETLDARNPSY